MIRTEKYFMGLVICLCLFPFAAIAAQPRSASTLTSQLRLISDLDFCGEPVPIDDADVRERMEKELLLSLWDRDQVILWLKRSHRYLPALEKQLAEAGVPDDLKYMVIAESAMRPHVGSPKGAMGFWQFMPETARRYGLLVNDKIDQRRNLTASSTAAIAYMKELHQEFGSWSLAATAFNMGEEGLRAEILAQEVDNFYRLYLSLESQRYLFRILAAKQIMSAPERFGFYLSEGDYYAPRQYTSVSLTLFEETSLTVVAKAAKSDFKHIKDLNPELRGHYLEAGTYTINIPDTAPTDFAGRFEALHKAWQRYRRESVYVVQAGDNLSLIAERFEVPLAALLIWNRISLNATLHPGDRLVIMRHGEGDRQVTE